MNGMNYRVVLTDFEGKRDIGYFQRKDEAKVFVKAIKKYWGKDDIEISESKLKVKKVKAIDE